MTIATGRARFKTFLPKSFTSEPLFVFLKYFKLDVSRLTLIVLPFLLAETLFAIRLGRGILGQFNMWTVLTDPTLVFEPGFHDRSPV